MSRTGFRDEWIYTRERVGAPTDDLRYLLQDVVAYWRGWEIQVKAGFGTDGASIPRFFWRAVGHPWGDYFAAAIVHDILYNTEYWTREEADTCFLDLMECLGVKGWRRKAMFVGVRVGGYFPWRRHKPKSVAFYRDFLTVLKQE